MSNSLLTMEITYSLFSRQLLQQGSNVGVFSCKEFRFTRHVELGLLHLVHLDQLEIIQRDYKLLETFQRYICQISFKCFVRWATCVMPHILRKLAATIITLVLLWMTRQVCHKYQITGKTGKFTMNVKCTTSLKICWYSNMSRLAFHLCYQCQVDLSTNVQFATSVDYATNSKSCFLRIRSVLRM